MINILLRSIITSLFIALLFALVLFFLNSYLDLNSLQYYFLISLFFCIFLSINSAYLYFIKIHREKSNFKSFNEIELLKSAAKYRREFLGNVSHELKTPLFNIQGYIETLLSGALYDKSVNKKYLKRTIKSVDRLIYIVQDLETISNLESDELSLNFNKWNLKNLINEIVDQFEIKVKDKNINLFQDKKTTNCNVYADKERIAQVLYNLISNSIKYGRKNGEIKISCHQSDNICLVSVKDNGIGISEKNISRLFERFYRVDKSRSREQGGTGLGLAIVKHIIEAHQQNIKIKSTLNRGTEFTFSLECVK
ncbi:MAG: two-component sensor histidine kinase [Flavobacteriales bacterium]|nr:two-component sensor histidine kinase [Flavobacteriales bacterium]|tara:strand:- start:740 stop:1666 length:927 start_codon:yes stop_codon:yes gene_type:complete